MLLKWGARTARELETMSTEDKRNTLIVELGGASAEPNM